MIKKRFYWTIVLLFLLEGNICADWEPAWVTFTVDGISYEVRGSINPGSGAPNYEPGDFAIRVYGGDARVTYNNKNPYSGDVVLPSSVVYDSYTFPVVSITENAFKDCTSLKSVYIPSSIDFCEHEYTTYQIIKDNYNPFKGCVNLERITFEKGHRYYNENNAIIVDGKLIAGCKNTIIPTTVSAIGYGAFYGYSSMKSIDIPTNVNVIGSYAFYGCSGFESIDLPASLRRIYGNAFKGCSNIKLINCYSTKLPTLVENDIDEGLVEWSWSDFFDESMKEATLYVNDYLIESFKSDKIWSQFKEILPFENVTDFNIIYYVDGEEHKTVKYKYEEKITPESYPVKEGYTFSGWSEIPTNMPGKEVKVYGTFTKNEVKEGSVVYWAKDENAVVTGNEDATGEVNILSTVEFNENELPVTEIDDNTFKNCAGITKVNIPATITKIGERAFANIDKLTDVTILAEDVPETDRTAFENSYIEDYVTLHVPAGSVEKYKAVAPWKNFKSVVAIAGTQKLPAPTVSFENGVLTFTCGVEDVKYNWTISSGGSQPSSVGSDKLSLPNVTNYVLSVYATKDGYENSETTMVRIHIDRADVNRDGKVDAADHVELTKVIMSYDGSETENDTTIEPYDDPTDL